jgi:FkbM family methyltransferase
MSEHGERSGLGMEVALKGLRDRGYAPAVVFDIGAADGNWTRMAMEFWPRASFVCFEPLVEWRTQLDALKADHPRQVSLQECGVGDADAELTLGVSDYLWESSFAYACKSERKVMVRRLDGLYGEGRIPRPSFVKIDVQGFERRVLEGGRELMSSVDFVLMECNFFRFCDEMQTLDETVAFMSALGFLPYEFVDFIRRPLDGAMGQCDLLFARRGHRLLSDHRWGG